MLSLEELKKETDLINEINWDLGPEEAVKLYLEWGNTNWGSGKYVIRSKNDSSTFVLLDSFCSSADSCAPGILNSFLGAMSSIDQRESLVEW